MQEGPRFTYDVKASDFEWLEGCFVGKVREVDNIQFLQEKLRLDGGVSCLIRPMEGDLVLLSSRDIVKLAEFVEGGSEWWSRWFFELHPWQVHDVSEQRCMWLRFDRACMLVLTSHLGLSSKKVLIRVQ
ncbi:hypothetical protein Ancab_033897 [Ancistrocladus abbreviatus]